MASFLDTNVLVYAFDRRDKRKQEIAQAVVSDDTTEFVVSAQVLNEFYWAVTRKLRPALSAHLAHEAVRDIALNRVVPLDASLVDEAITLARGDGLSLWDAAIVVAAKRAGCESLLSEDLQAGRVFGSVTIQNPFT